MLRAVVVASLLVLLSAAGHAGPNPAPPPIADGKTVIEKLTRFLPAELGSFAAINAVVSTETKSRVELERHYRTPDGRSLSVRIVTGDLALELTALDTNAEHAFGSDTPTYWKTTAIRGLRTRIAENRGKRAGSTAYVRVSTLHIAVVEVYPAVSDGESASLAARLDLERIAASPGLPAPPTAPTR
jgi:hypothetical protein